MSDSFATPWTVACRAPLSMGFSRSGLSFPSPGDFPDTGIELCLLYWQADSSTTDFMVRKDMKGC